MGIPHTLAQEFPNEAALIEYLRRIDRDFGQLAAHYDEVNEAVARIESEDEPTSDEVLETFKKQRLALKDRIAARLHRAKSEMPHFATSPAGHAQPHERSGR